MSETTTGRETWQVAVMDGHYDAVYSSAPNTHYGVSPTSAPFLCDYLNALEARVAALTALVDEVVVHMREAARDHCALQNDEPSGWLARAALAGATEASA